MTGKILFEYANEGWDATVQDEGLDGLAITLSHGPITLRLKDKDLRAIGWIMGQIHKDTVANYPDLLRGGKLDA